MSDIVHWLRKLAALVEADHAPQHVVMHMRAGADEIERLRAALREIVKQSEAARKNVAYRKRIRFYENPLNEAHDEGALQAHEILADIARAALEGK